MSYGLASDFQDTENSQPAEGVLAPEAACSGTSTLLPMLALGIPGSATAAV
jgi:TctA family transporter